MLPSWIWHYEQDTLIGSSLDCFLVTGHWDGPRYKVNQECHAMRVQDLQTHSLLWWIGIWLPGQILPLSTLQNNTSFQICSILEFKFWNKLRLIKINRLNNDIFIEYLKYSSWQIMACHLTVFLPQDSDHEIALYSSYHLHTGFSWKNGT